MITLGQANAVIAAILARGREPDCRPFAVAMVEPGAVVKAFQKEDHGAMPRFEMAYGKAHAALALGRSSNLVRIRAEERPPFMDCLTRASDDRIFPEGGGRYPCRPLDGRAPGHPARRDPGHPPPAHRLQGL